MFTRRLLPLVLLLLSLHSALATSQTPYLQVSVDHPIIVFAGPQTTVTLTAQAVGFTATGITWTQIPDTINHLATQGTATFGPQGATTTAALPAKGVYEFQATATSASGSVTARTWVQVWDNRGALSPGSLGTGPGITPPPSVRQLSANPPAFQHPRVLFTNADWPDMHTRGTTGVVAGYGVNLLRSWVASTIDTPSSANGQFAAALYAWAQGGMTSTPPDPTPLAADGQLSCGAYGVFSSMLLDACYLQWLDNDPTVPQSQLPAAAQQRGAYLATLVSAAAALRLSSVWNSATGQFTLTGPAAIRNINAPGEPPDPTGMSDLAMAYDLIYNWMTTPQQQQTRDFLYAAGWGRHTSFGGWDGNTQTLNTGRDQNGDFGNLSDNNVLMELAIEGEESAVSPDVVAAFGHAAPGSVEARWVQVADPTTPSAWPGATVADVDNLQREISWLNDWSTTPWGTATDYLAYLGLSAQYLMPSCLAYARRGDNIFVTTNTYQLALHPIMIMHPGETNEVSSHGLGQTNQFWFDHHDSSSFGQRGTMSILWKYMYPDDPLIDYDWRAYLPSQYEDPLTCAMFGIDPSVGVPAQTLPQVAQAKGLPTTILDPQRGIIDMHSAWDDNAMSMWFECNGGDALNGHMHAERNSFDFFALGRAWAVAPGYHETISDLQSAVLVRDPRYVYDAATNGFIGESASSATQQPPYYGNHPTPPGTILQMTEAPDHSYTLLAGDATLAYQDAYQGNPQGNNPIDTGLPLTTWMYPGLSSYFDGLDSRYTSEFSQDLFVGDTAYNPVRNIYRTVLFVRGPQPYALVVDDDDKDSSPQDWQWVINDQISFGGPGNSFVDANGNGIYSSLLMQPGATPTDAVLYHIIDSGSAPGLPRLLLRDVGLTNPADQPPIILQSRPSGQTNIPYLTYGVDNNNTSAGLSKVPSNRVIIERDGVPEPGYAVLMFPFRTGQSLPTTTWNANQTALTINLGGGVINTVYFDRTAPDHRTRLTFEQGSAPPSGPTVATAASATPNPVAGKTTAVSVLGADTAGESTLTYDWGATGPAPVTFSANGTNAAKSATATFTQAGTYTLTVIITDAGGAVTTSSVAVTVNQTLTTITVLPSFAQVPTGQTQQFAATALDQFGVALSPQPTAFTWAATGYGTISNTGLFTAGSAAGSATITASSGSVTSAPATASSASALVYRINAGGPAVAPFAADADFTGGSANSTGTAISAAAANAAPAAVYQTGRFGTFSYAFPGLTPGAPYLVRLHFAETYWNAAGKRIQNVTVNGSPTLTNFDIFAAAGAAFKAVVETVPATADSSGKVTVAFAHATGSADGNALVAGLELLSTTSPTAPTVAAAASASPNPVTGTTTAVSVLGADAGGEPGLTYAWSATGPAAVTFSANGTNAAKSATATFTQLGSYTLTVTITNAMGGMITSSVPVTVNQTVMYVAVSPTTETLAAGQTQPFPFTAIAIDQFDNILSPSPAFTWAATGDGTVSTTGLFTAGTTPGSASVTASAAGVTSLAASVTVTAGPASQLTFSQQPTNAIVGNKLTPAVTVQVADSYGNPIAGAGVSLALTSGGTLGGTLTQTTNSAGTSTFPDLSVAAKGTYTLTATLGSPSVSAVSTAFTISPVGSAPVPVFQINAGGPAVAPFAADADFTGGSANSTGTAISVAAANAAPAAVYQTGRFGTFSYAFPGLTPGAPYLVRLHFAETYWNAAGKRIQNVTVNGSPALTNFDIFAAAGGEFKAVVETVPATADGSGKVTVAFAHVSGSADGNALVAGLEVIKPALTAPTVAAAASASPNPVTGTTTAVSVLGADAGGESGLTYTWSATGPAPVTFSANGTNAAKSATATFTQLGSYTLTATITNAGGLTATSSVAITVNPTLTAIAVAPATATVSVGQTQPFTATARDQFGVALSPQPTAFTWAATGDGTVSTTGLFTAVTAGPAAVTAASGSVTSPAAAVTVTAATTTTALASSLNPSTVSQSVTLTATVAGAGPTGTVTFTLDGAAQPAAALTGGKAALTTSSLTAGTHTVTAAYSGDGANAASASTTLTQAVAAPTITVSPASASVAVGGAQQFGAVATGQGGAPLSPQPAFTWAATGGGTISAGGLFTAGGAAGGPYTVTASTGGVSGAASVTVTPQTTWLMSDPHIGHVIGRADSGGWSASTAQDPVGFMQYGPYTTQAAPGAHAVTWQLMVDNNTFTGDTGPVLELQVFDTTTGALLAVRDVQRREWAGAYRYQGFSVPFTLASPSSGHKLEFRVFWYRRSYVREQSVAIQ